MTGLHPQGSQNGHQDPDPVEYDRSLDELIDDLMKQQVSRQWASPAILSTLPTSDSLSHTHTHTPPPPSPPNNSSHTLTQSAVPVKFLYDSVGSQLYEEITQLPEYTPYKAEKKLLQLSSKDMLSYLPRHHDISNMGCSDWVIVELGCGDASKSTILLRQALDINPSVHFVGIDVSSEALAQAASNLSAALSQGDENDDDDDNRHHPGLTTDFICAEYLDGLKEARQRHHNKVMLVLLLGSTIGNFTNYQAVEFIKQVATIAGAGGKDGTAPWQFLLCTDLYKDPSILKHAYDDGHNLTRAFMINGIRNALRSLGHSGGDREDILWRYKARVNRDEKQVEMYVQPSKVIENVKYGEKKLNLYPDHWILMEISRKFTEQSIAWMIQEAGLYLCSSWNNVAGYSAQLIESVQDAFIRCWKDTDAIFTAIGDIANWDAAPIKLRHPFKFYAGHIVAFARLKLLPRHQHRRLDHMFSRGMDPIVGNPSLCHSRPETLSEDEWPNHEALMQYVEDARREILDHLDTSSSSGDNDGAEKNKMDMHAVNLLLEHERMHQETLGYMLAQHNKNKNTGREREREKEKNGNESHLISSTSDKIDGDTTKNSRQPYYYANPSCTYLSTALPAAAGAAAASTKESYALVPGCQVILGLHALETRGFNWDNELYRVEGRMPQKVPSFEISKFPVTCEEWARFTFVDKGYEREELWTNEDFWIFKESGQTMPATWSISDHDGNGYSKGAAVKIKVHMPEGSYDFNQVAHCPVYVSMSEAEAYLNLMKTKSSDDCDDNNNVRGYRLMTEAEWEAAMVQKTAAAIRFGRDLIEERDEDILQVEMLDSGGWEWTSSVFAPIDSGFSPDALYPEYSVDFFDGVHYILKGSSPYTRTRRRPIRNFYQRNYAYVFSKFRVVRDVL